MPVLRLFAAAREAAGVGRVDLEGGTVAEVLEQAHGRYGDRFSAVVARSRVWVNGEPAAAETPLRRHDVVAVLPPVSGGSGDLEAAGRSADGGAVAVVEARPRRTLGPPSARRLLPAAAPEPVRPPPATDEPAADEPAADEPAADQPAADQPTPAARGTRRRERPPDGEPFLVGAKRTLALLAVLPRPTRPHGRIGVLWAAVTVTAAIAGQGWLAGWLATAAFVGASQTAGARRVRGERPPAALAGITAVALPVAAVYGTRQALLAGGIAVGLALLAVVLLPGRAMGRELGMAILIGAIAGGAAAAPVVARGLGADAAVFLLACVCIYDASAYLVGTGAASVWEGPLAGVVALIPVTILAAVVLVPPFPTGTPLLLGALAAVLTPLGPLVATALLGSRETDAPGLRRLDSLILAGPLWTWVAVLVLR